MQVVFDTETALIQRGLLAPPLTCMSFLDEGGRYGLVDRHTAHDMMLDWLRQPDVELTGHNTAFDTAAFCAEFPDLLPYFFRAYDAGRIRDTMIDEMLLDIAEGHFRWEIDPLTDMVIRRKSYELGRLTPGGLEKDKWRLMYGTLRDVPVERWERGAIEYPIKDTFATAALKARQFIRAGHRVVPDGAAQARNHFALHLMSTWGMRTDIERVSWLQGALEQSCDQLADKLVQFGMLRGDGTRDMDAIRQRLAATGVTLTYTPTGQISTASDLVKEAAEADPSLHYLLEYVDHLKLLTTYVPALLTGLVVPINARFNPLVETGRTSCSRPNLQNLPRGKNKGTDLSKHVRECFIPRRGFHFVDCDYDTLEVRTLGQALYDLLGGTTLRDAFQRDPDFDQHTNLASRILGCSYEEGMHRKTKGKDDALFDDTRQMCKPPDFGYPGGMGAKKMRAYAWKSYGVHFTQQQSEYLRWQFLRSIPEMQRYFHMNGDATRTGSCTVVQLRSGRVRGGCAFTDTCNGWFQALAADGAKFALWEVSKACYVDRHSVMYGSRPVCFIHDQIITESPEEVSGECALEQKRIMEHAMEASATPDIPSRAGAVVTKRWIKGAKQVKDAHGRIIPYEPRAKARMAA